MKWVLMAGGGLLIIGLINLDWFEIGLGVIIIAGCFIYGFRLELLKKKGAMTDEKVFELYKALHPLIRIIRQALEGSEVDASTSKVKLVEGLFYLGMVDAASQSADMDDGQFLSLFKATFADIDYDFNESYQTKLFQYHQAISTDESAYQAIMEGGKAFVKFRGGNTTSILTTAPLIHSIAENTDFPSSVEEL